MVRIIFLAVILVFTTTQLKAQIGLRSNYHNLNAISWERLANLNISDPEGTALSTMGYSVGIDYWFRLTNYRVEFFPELGYAQLSTFSTSRTDYNWTQLYARLNTHFYVLDFEEDCDCPTFSNQSPWFKKGFFLSISGGAGYSTFDIFYPEATVHNEVNYFASIGAGIDIGLSDFFTLTPNIQWGHWITPNWVGLSQDSDTRAEKTPVSAVNFGLRLGFRFVQ